MHIVSPLYKLTKKQCNCIFKETETLTKERLASVKLIFKARGVGHLGGLFYALILILLGKRAGL